MEFLNELRNLRTQVELLDNVYSALLDLKDYDGVIFTRIVGDLALEKIEKELAVAQEKLGILEQKVISEYSEA